MSDGVEKDLGGGFDAAYIDHPRRVSEMVADDPLAVPAAWLHDVVEDCGVTAEDLCDAGVHRKKHIADNTAPDRVAWLKPADRERLAVKYEKALRALGAGRADR